MEAYPYTNLQNLNLDWILEVVADFKSKYTDFGQAVTDSLQAIEDAKDASLETLANALAASTTTINNAKMAAIQEMEEEKASILDVMSQTLQTAITAVETAQEAAVADVGAEKDLGLTAINTAYNQSVAQLQNLIATFPLDDAQIIGQLQIINSILNGTDALTVQWQQGRYSYVEQDQEYIWVNSPNTVSSVAQAGCGGRKLHVKANTTGHLIAYIYYWTGNWQNTPATSVPINATETTFIFPSNAIYFTVLLGTSADMTTPINLADVTASANWLVEGYELQASGDINRTNDILSRLTADKICRLGTGIFYVQNLEMPDDSELIGAGPDTKIVLMGTDIDTGFAVKLGNRCTISNLSVLGNLEDHTAYNDRYDKTASYTERHGILWQGTAAPGSSGNVSRRALISNCYIANFTGGGITLTGTGLNVIASVNVSNVWIWYCYAGINIPYYSEYNRFSNVSCTNCHYGAINNGGNNMFSNCNFSANIEGMLIDNTNSGAPNNSHGTITNCNFNHSDQNFGIGIHLIGVSFGEIINACQLFLSSIEVESCNGVVLHSVNGGQAENIVIKNSKGIVLSDCMFRTAPTFVLMNNKAFIISNCVAYEGTNPIILVPSNVDITSMPTDFIGNMGDPVTFTVIASNVVSYQWQWRRQDNSNPWTDSTITGYNTPTLSTEINATRLTYKYRCKLTDAGGYSVYTDSVKMVLQ